MHYALATEVAGQKRPLIRVNSNPIGGSLWFQLKSELITPPVRSAEITITPESAWSGSKKGLMGAVQHPNDARAAQCRTMVNTTDPNEATLEACRFSVRRNVEKVAVTTAFATSDGVGHGSLKLDRLVGRCGSSLASQLFDKGTEFPNYPCH